MSLWELLLSRPTTTAQPTNSTLTCWIICQRLLLNTEEQGPFPCHLNLRSFFLAGIWDWYYWLHVFKGDLYTSWTPFCVLQRRKLKITGAIDRSFISGLEFQRHVPANRVISLPVVGHISGEVTKKYTLQVVTPSCGIRYIGKGDIPFGKKYWFLNSHSRTSVDRNMVCVCAEGGMSHYRKPKLWCLEWGRNLWLWDVNESL